MDLKRKFIKKFIIGFIIGIPICPLITYAFSSMSGHPYFCDPILIKMFGSTIIAFLIQSLISSTYSGLCMGGSIVYEIEEWGILKTTATHFVLTFILFDITGLLLHWWSFHDIITNIIVFLMFLIPYSMIWLIQYIIYKIELKKINKDIQEFRKNNITK